MVRVRESYSWVLILSYALFISLLAYIDVITGYEISLTIFYLLPISLAAWYYSGRAACIISAISAMVWIAADIKSGEYHSHMAVQIWNSGAALIYYLLISYFLSKLKKLYEHEKELARTDPLTGTLNRRYFYIAAENEIHRARRFRRPVSLAFFDIDNFKLVNDTLGHAYGDDLLKIITGTISANLRTYDLIGRFGGDEFAILLPETGRDQAREVIRKIQKILMEKVHDNKWPISFSIGVVTSPGGDHKIDELVKESDRVMYSVKKHGKNNVKYFTMEEKKSSNQPIS